MIVGNFLSGAKLCIDGETIELSAKLKWYEVVIAILPLIFMWTLGNTAALCSIFPVVGGAIGGVIGAIGWIVALLVMKKSVNPFYKIITGFGVAIATVLASFLLALAFLSLAA